KVVADLNGQFATRHVNGDRAVTQSQLVRDGRRRAAAGAGRQRVSGSAFPDLDLNVAPIQRLQKLHVCALRKTRVGFEQRAVLLRQPGTDVGQRQNTVRIANRRRAKIEGAVSDDNLFVDDFATG